MSEKKSLFGSIKLPSVLATLSGKSEKDENAEGRKSSGGDGRKSSGNEGRQSTSLGAKSIMKMNMRAERTQIADLDGLFDDIDNPEMYEELGIIKPARRAMLSKYEHEKIYEYLLNRDTKILHEKVGDFRERDDNYIAARRKADTLFREIEKPAFNVGNGNFEKIAEMTMEISWRATSQPNFSRSKQKLPEYEGYVILCSVLSWL
jgi:hypothetical protein